MRRQALIIINPGEEGAENYCAGVLKDAENYKHFLQSPQGGYWFEEEIRLLNRPTETELDVGLRLYSLYCDYLLLIFSGHGYVNSDGSTIFELRKGCEISANELRLSSTAQTMIIDCCREAVPPVPRFIRAVIEKAIPRINPARCREKYDEQIRRCGLELVVMYACSIGQKAGDDSGKGGVYLSSLLDAADKWVQEQHSQFLLDDYKVLSVVEAHNKASLLVKELRGDRQTPVIEKPRQGPYFPFCIIA